MTRLILSILVFVAVSCISVPLVFAQAHALIRDDFKQYTRSFQNGKDPYLGPDTKRVRDEWRRKYTDHKWARYAEETERTDPMLEAQVLMGIYLTQEVDHRLFAEIQKIIYGKAYMSSHIAERIKLSEIAMYLDSRKDDPDIKEKLDAVGKGDELYSPQELDRMEIMNRNIDEEARKWVISAPRISSAMRTEIREVENKFYSEEQGWVATYYAMRERFLILDALAKSFTFNWSKEKRAEYLQELVEDPEIIREGDKKAKAALMPASTGMDGSSSPSSYDYPGSMNTSSDPMSGGEDYQAMMTMMPMTPRGPVVREPTEEEKTSARLEVAVEKLKQLEAREVAYKYIVGVYKSSEYHLGMLRQIRRYYRSAAEQGDPIAQFHLALFLRFLGDIVEPYADEQEKQDFLRESDEWLKKAAMSDITKKRVEALNAQLAEEVKKADKREEALQRKLEALIRSELEKLGTFDTVLITVRDSIGTRGGGLNDSGGSNGGGTSGSGRGNRSSRGSDSGMSDSGSSSSSP